MNHVIEYRAVSACRALMRQGHEPAAAARMSARQFGIDADGEANIRKLAVVAEVDCQAIILKIQTTKGSTP